MYALLFLAVFGGDLSRDDFNWFSQPIPEVVIAPPVIRPSILESTPLIEIKPVGHKPIKTFLEGRAECKRTQKPMVCFRGELGEDALAELAEFYENNGIIFCLALDGDSDFSTGITEFVYKDGDVYFKNVRDPAVKTTISQPVMSGGCVSGSCGMPQMMMVQPQPIQQFVPQSQPYIQYSQPIFSSGASSCPQCQRR